MIVGETHEAILRKSRYSVEPHQVDDRTHKSTNFQNSRKGREMFFRIKDPARIPYAMRRLSIYLDD
jgi:hypothetical protein